jgi:bifunctional UDP-N-acetylglucosamine pyrophosphorylase/glucosamine-1-phosphate N-acetyltransferase
VSEQERSGQGSASNLAVVILAAGNGEHLKTRRPEALHAVGGKTLLAHALTAAQCLVAAPDIVVVVPTGETQVREAAESAGCKIVELAERQGRGNALQSARRAIDSYENIVVLPADLPLLRPETVAKLERSHRAEKAAMTILTAPGIADETVPGIYAFRADALLKHLDELPADRARGEVSLADMAVLLRAADEAVVKVVMNDGEEALQAKTIPELVALDAKLRAATASRLMGAGVTIYRPETCVIDADVEVAADTVIEPFVQLLGNTKIGAACRIRSYSVLESCTLGDNVLIRPSCMLTESSIAEGADIGPFARMRMGCEVGEKVHVGNFVELKKAKLQRGVKAGHLAYLGDAEIGADVNIGAGVITCNYDGVRKHVTQIGEGAFVGSDSTLVAPVKIGAGAYVGAGSCITKEVPADALALARALQVVKEGWAAERRARRKLEAAAREDSKR